MPALTIPRPVQHQPKTVPAHRPKITTHLLRWLRETPARALQPDVYSRYVATAWNAAYQGRELYQIRPRRNEQALLLTGTPHDGTAHRHYVTPDGTVLHTPEPWPEEI